MPTSSTPRPSVLSRIILAKKLLKSGESFCSTRNDQMIFTQGMLLLHDAAESALGAIADHLHVDFKKKNYYLLDYYSLIKDKDPEKRTIPYNAQMKRLNTLRNDAKHQGIFPDIKSNGYLPATVHDFIKDLCKTYLSLDFDSISLKSLIRDKEILDYIDRAEKEINARKIDEGLISLAYAMYHICEVSTIPLSLQATLGLEKEKPIRFTEAYTLNQTVQLLEYGVDPYLYHRFKNLTPIIGKEAETNKLIHWWDKHYGHPGNWTPRNANFCLNFCIETALKFQREPDEGYTLIPYVALFENVIEPAKEKAIIWNQSLHPPEFLLPVHSPEPRKQVLTLEKGQRIVGWATDSENRLDEWFIMSKDLPSGPTSDSGVGYALKSDVKVTQRKRQASE